MGDYGNNVDRINDSIKEATQNHISGLGDDISSLQTIATENWNQTNADYTAKYGHLAEGGGAEVAGAFGLKGIYKGARTLKKTYDKYQKQASDGDDPLLKNDTQNPTGADSQVPENLPAEDVPNVPQTGDAPQISTDDFASKDAFDFVKEEGNPDVPLSQTSPLEGADTQPDLVEVANKGLGSTEETDLPQIDTSPQVDEIQPAPTEAPLAGETENLVEQTAKTTAEKATEEVGEGVVEKGLTSGLGDLVAGAIPVVGEGLLAVAGLVSIGEGIYHLFHHKTKQPTVSTVATDNLVTPPSQTLTQKYSLALPSIDSASEQSASVSSF
jgi:hypothetical protein